MRKQKLYVYQGPTSTKLSTVLKVQCEGCQGSTLTQSMKSTSCHFQWKNNKDFASISYSSYSTSTSFFSFPQQSRAPPTCHLLKIYGMAHFDSLPIYAKKLIKIQKIKPANLFGLQIWRLYLYHFRFPQELLLQLLIDTKSQIKMTMHKSLFTDK